MEMVNIHMLKEIYMKVNINMKKEMEKGLIYIIMVINMLETGKKEENMVMVYSIIVIKVGMKMNIKTVKRKEKENIIVKMEIIMKEIIKTIEEKEKVFSFLKEEINMKEILEIIISIERVFILIKKVMFIMAVSIRIFSIDKAPLLLKMEINMRVDGKMI